MYQSTEARRVTPLVAIPALILLAGSLHWIIRDATVWPWDQAWYGEVTVQLARLRHGPALAWLQGNLTAFGSKPPLLAWIGQFFTPLIRLYGTVESALLTANLVFAATSYLLVAQTAAKLGCGRLQQCLAVLLLGGASLYMGSIHQYFVETLQVLTVCILMRATFGFERRSLPISILIIGCSLALAMLAKASSFTFAAPLLFYAILAAFSGPRSRAGVHPAVLLALAAVSGALIAACVAWYAVNWAAMAQHFRAATSSEIALAYGSIGPLNAKLPFWLAALGKALTPWPAITWGLVAIIAYALANDIVKIIRMPFARWLQSSVESGLLFALALTGTIVTTLIGLSLQINEETRFLSPLLPMIAVLSAWALRVIGSQAITAIVLAGAALNGAVGVAYANRLNPLNISPSVWLKPYDTDGADRIKLQAAVNASCKPERPNRYVIIGVEYPSFNANSAAFFSEKAMIRRGFRCYYTSVGYAETNIETAVKRIDDLMAEHIVTVRPDFQRSADGFNMVAKPFAERASQLPGFSAISATSDDLLILERKNP